jgi:hypothetical protein
MFHHVKDLSPEQRHAAEILLGHAVSEDEAVSIKSLGLSTLIPSRLSPEARIEAFKALNERLANPGVCEVDAEEEESAINEAMRSTRPNYRPVG